MLHQQNYALDSHLRRHAFGYVSNICFRSPENQEPTSDQKGPVIKVKIVVDLWKRVSKSCPQDEHIRHKYYTRKSTRVRWPRERGLFLSDDDANETTNWYYWPSTIRNERKRGRSWATGIIWGAEPEIGRLIAKQLRCWLDRNCVWFVSRSVLIWARLLFSFS